MMSEEGDHLDVAIKQVFERMKKLGPKPRSCPDDQVLAAYHEGSLTQEKTEGIEEHLALCDRCTENLIVLSETVNSFEPAKESLATKEMVKRAKNLVKPIPDDAPSLWERVFSWLSSIRPIPIMAAACAALVLVVLGLYNVYMPHEPGGKESIPFGLRIIAKIPDEMVTRGKTPTYKEVEIKDGGVLQSGDMFRIRFEVQTNAYVYLLALNSQGDLNKLFPGRDGTPFKAKPREYYTVPYGNEWFRLDDKTGKERLYLISSPKIIENIDKKVKQLKQSGIDEIKKIFTGIRIQSFSFKHE